jgi:hypothetical protein
VTLPNSHRDFRLRNGKRIEDVRVTDSKADVRIGVRGADDRGRVDASGPERVARVRGNILQTDDLLTTLLLCIHFNFPRFILYRGVPSKVADWPATFFCLPVCMA